MNVGISTIALCLICTYFMFFLTKMRTETKGEQVIQIVGVSIILLCILIEFIVVIWSVSVFLCLVISKIRKRKNTIFALEKKGNKEWNIEDQKGPVFYRYIVETKKK